MHNSGIRGTQEVGIPTYTHAQRKEVCVADSDEAAMKAGSLNPGSCGEECPAMSHMA